MYSGRAQGTPGPKWGLWGVPTLCLGSSASLAIPLSQTSGSGSQAWEDVAAAEPAGLPRTAKPQAEWGLVRPTEPPFSTPGSPPLLGTQCGLYPSLAQSSKLGGGFPVGRPTLGDRVVQSDQGAFLANVPDHSCWVLEKPQPRPDRPFGGLDPSRGALG